MDFLRTNYRKLSQDQLIKKITCSNSYITASWSRPIPSDITRAKTIYAL